MQVMSETLMQIHYVQSGVWDGTCMLYSLRGSHRVQVMPAG